MGEKQLIRWDAEASKSLLDRVVHIPHDLGRLPELQTERLQMLLDRHPRNRIQCYTMLPDPERLDSVRAVDPGDANGAALWRAVARGRLWLNVRAVHETDPALGELVRALMAELMARCPSMKAAKDPNLDLLVSSEGSHTHFHMDRGPSVLLHLVGQKRAWIYPAQDGRIVAQEDAEAIYADQRLENLPWRPELDAFAQEVRLTPGQGVSWPNGSPHRVLNDSFCVSLNLSFATPESERRSRVHRANHLLRRAGVKAPSAEDFGFAAAAKASAYRCLSAFGGLKPSHAYKTAHTTHLRIDPDNRRGVQRLSEPVLPLFLQPRP